MSFGPKWQTEQQRLKKSDQATDTHLGPVKMDSNTSNNKASAPSLNAKPVNRPQSKLPPRPKSTSQASLVLRVSKSLAVHVTDVAKDSKVHKRPINRNHSLQRGSIPTNPKQRIIYVGTKSPFMGIVSRVRKALNNGPAGVHANSSTKGLPLVARVAALNSPSSDKGEEVLVRGTGRAMAKTLEIAAWFTHQADCKTTLRTMTLETVDDVVVDEDEAEEEGGFAAEEESRVRMVNCLEVGVSLR